MKNYENKQIITVSHFNDTGLSDIELIAKLASLSYNKKEAKDNVRLVSLLLERGHHSLFEFVALRRSRHYEIQYLEVPIFVARQIMRHRTFSYIERSFRYTQGDTRYFLYDNNDFTDIYDAIDFTYNKLLDKYKKEVARVVLPMGTYTKLYIGGNVFAWTNFFIYRLDKAAQDVTRATATLMAREIKQYNKSMYDAILDELELWHLHKLNFIDDFATSYGLKDISSKHITNLYNNAKNILKEL